MSQDTQNRKSFCRQCGGERSHLVIGEKTYRLDDDGSGFDGCETWSILECCGCHTVTLVYSHWFSEDCDGHGRPINYYHFYPPSPTRKIPEWMDAYYSYSAPESSWLFKLLADIYEALGLESYSLAAMGIRAVIDGVVTDKAGDAGAFTDKLKRLLDDGIITEISQGIISTAFDAGSAAIHRGFVPQPTDVYTLLDVAEDLLYRLYVAPVQEINREKAARSLKEKTPPRPKIKK